jgi:hypothetical protein
MMRLRLRVRLRTGIALGELANALPKPVTGTTTVTPGN